MNLSENKVAVRVQGVFKHFGEGDARIYALKDTSFEAYFGEIMMIVGPSGCGKTTLLSVIAGTLHVDQGAIDVFGLPLHMMKSNDITYFRGQNVGFIFQQFNLIPTLTIQENVVIPLLIQGKSKKESYQQASEFLEKVGLGNRLNARPTQLSGGQQERVAIARALIHQPRLVICDEPTANLDGETGHKIMELLQQIAKSHDRCVIVVTHDSRIFEFADRRARMEDGQVKNVQQNPHA